MQTPIPLWQLRAFSDYWHSPIGIAQLAWEQTILNTFNERSFGHYVLGVELHTLNIFNQCSIHQRLNIVSCVNNKNNTLNHTLSLNGFIDLTHWPLHSDSLDYIILPHVLEFSDNPHAVLREAARCLRAGGHLTLLGFNPHSALGLSSQLNTGLSPSSYWLSRRRLLDWLRLLNLYPDRGAFGQWRPVCIKQSRFDSLLWLDKAGERWWPHGANVYALRMVKQLPSSILPVSMHSEFLFNQVLGTSPIGAINAID